MDEMAPDRGAVTSAGSAAGPRTRRAARNAVVVAVAELIGKVATFVLVIVAARALGEGGFGEFSFALSYGLLFETLIAFGFGSLLVQRGSAEPHRLNELFSELVLWRTSLAVPVFVIAGLLGVLTRPADASVAAFLLILAGALLEAYTDAGRAAAAAKQDLRWVSVAMIVQRVATAAMGIAAIAAGLGLVGLAASYFAGNVLGTAGVAVTVRRLGVRFDRSLVTRAGMLETGRQAIPIGIDTVVAMALFRVDQVILGAMKGDAAVGLYAAGYRLLETVLFVTWAVGRAVYPVMSATTDAGQVRRGLERSLAAVAAVYIPFGVGLAMEAETVLRTLFGAEFADGVDLVRWLAPVPLLFAVGFLGSHALLSRQRRWAVAGSSVVAAAVNVGLNLVLIPSLAGTGAAIATAAAYGLEAAIVLWLLASEVGWARVDRALAVPLAATAVMAAALLAIPGETLAEIAVGAAVYGVAWFALARWRAPEQVAVLSSLLPGRRAGSPPSAPPSA